MNQARISGLNQILFLQKVMSLKTFGCPKGFRISMKFLLDLRTIIAQSICHWIVVFIMRMHVYVSIKRVTRVRESWGKNGVIQKEMMKTAIYSTNQILIGKPQYSVA